MTKKFERYYRGNITDIIGQIQADGVKGEYTVVIDNR
jgi:16S rRNA C1402 (ribose-2'-O) methylase RsmI